MPFRIASRVPALCVLLTSIGMTLPSTGLDAQTAQQLPTAAQTDPKTLGMMQGFPPPPDKTIRFIDGSSLKFPNTRWAFSHIRELVPTANVSRGEGAVVPLPRAERDLGNVAITTMDGRAITFNDALQLTYTDGILVLHKGKVVYEKYLGEGSAQRPHIAFSVTKSFVGTLAAILAADGKLNPAAPVTKYVPELKDSAYGDATVRQVMDMTIGVKFSENYSDPQAEVFDYARAGGMVPLTPNYQGPRTFFDFLVKLKKEGEHGNGFFYKTANAEVLAWIVKRASGPVDGRPAIAAGLVEARRGARRLFHGRQHRHRIRRRRSQHRAARSRPLRRDDAQQGQGERQAGYSGGGRCRHREGRQEGRL